METMTDRIQQNILDLESLQESIRDLENRAVVLRMHLYKSVFSRNKERKNLKFLLKSTQYTLVPNSDKETTALFTTKLLPLEEAIMK